MLGEIQAIAHHKGVGHCEAHVVEWHVDLSAFAFVQQGSDLEPGPVALAK